MRPIAEPSLPGPPAPLMFQEGDFLTVLCFRGELGRRCSAPEVEP